MSGVVLLKKVPANNRPLPHIPHTEPVTVADKRYNTQRWRRVRRLVLQRDMYRCWITGCPRLANQCAHIISVEPGFPDSLFFGMHNLRASCRPHNMTQGVAPSSNGRRAKGCEDRWAWRCSTSGLVFAEIPR